MSFKNNVFLKLGKQKYESYKIVQISIVQMRLIKNLFEKMRLFKNKVVIVWKSKQTFFRKYLVPESSFSS